MNQEELLNELTRLNRQGIVNDEEFLVLRRLLREKGLSERTADDFHRLFVAKSPPRDDD